MSDAERQDGRGFPSPGAGWVDRPESTEVLRALAEKIGEQQRRVAASPHARLHGEIDRGQHQKRHLGARGTLRILADVPPPLNVSLFATPGSYGVACRFSNGQPCPFADGDPDVRGVALKLFTADGTETDFLMTNEGGRSHAANAVQFMEFADVLVAQVEAGAPGALRALTQEVMAGTLGVGEAARILGILGKEVLFHSVASLATERYWGSVVALGTAAVKHSLHPHPNTPAGTQGNGNGDDYLRDDLLLRLAAGPVRWRLGLQAFVDETRTPVNDASVEWDAPLVIVGELEIASVPSAADETLIDQMAFNPGNGFAPLGITHARRAVYAASARNRARRGLLSSDEARRFLA